MIKNEEKQFYCLLYPDKTKAELLPGSEEPFTLQRYKEEIGKPYSKIVSYLCRWAEYYSAHVNERGYSSGNENRDQSVLDGLIQTCWKVARVKKSARTSLTQAIFPSVGIRPSKYGNYQVFFL